MTTATVLGAPLAIAGGPLEPVVARFLGELTAAGIRLVPDVYLADEWGVPWADDAGMPFAPPCRGIAVPFYLASPGLLAREHRRPDGGREEVTADCLLPYLRHEMGHVIGYAYRLYRRRAWTKHFGRFQRPFRRSGGARPDFISLQAQQHPDEDWAETFAAWLDPAWDCRSAYADRPAVLAKLRYCGRVMADLARRPLPPTQGPLPGDAIDRVPDGWFAEDNAAAGPGAS